MKAKEIIAHAEKTKTYVRDIKRSYQLTFPKDSPAQQAVLKDLAKYCQATGVGLIGPDDRTTYIRLGRNQVFHYIARYLHLSVEELYNLYGGVQMPSTTQEDEDTDV